MLLCSVCVSLLHPRVVQTICVFVCVCAWFTFYVCDWVYVSITLCCWHYKVVEGPDCVQRREWEFPGFQRRASERLEALLSQSSLMRGHRPTLCVHAWPGSTEHAWTTGESDSKSSVKIVQGETNTLQRAVISFTFHQLSNYWNKHCESMIEG